MNFNILKQIGTYLIFTFGCFIVVFTASAQDNGKDSLIDLLKRTNSQEKRTKILFELGEFHYLSNNDSAVYYYKKAQELSNEINDSIYFAASTIQLGKTYRYIDPVKFAEYTMEAQVAAKKSGDAHNIMQSNRLLALLYRSQKELDKAMDVYKKMLVSSKHANDSLEIAWTYNGIGIIHMMKSEYDEGLEYWKKSLELKLRLGDIHGASSTMSNIGLYYKDINRFEEAKKYILESLKLDSTSNNYESAAFNLSNLGSLYTKTNEFNKGIEAFKSSLAFSDSTNNYFDKKETLLGLYKLYKKKGDHSNALDTHEDYVEILEAEFDKNNSEIIKSLTTKFETEKKEQQLAIVSAENKLIQSNFNYVLVFLMLISVGLVTIVFILRKVRRAKKQVENQRYLIQQKNDEIMDSIRYAKRLQDAILPSRNEIKKSLKYHFIYFNPKDIVAGDFYWFEQVKNHTFFAVADCTGHGVPGAMVSVVCSNALTKVVLEEKEYTPSIILDRAKEIIIDQFKKSGEKVNDGMDISLCRLDTETNQLEWAGAHNPLWVIRQKNNIDSESINNIKIEDFNDCTLLEYKADKQPVGNFEYGKPFRNNLIQLYPEDELYLFTDGFADQFGGEKGKKYKSGTLKKFLIKIRDVSTEKQEELISKEFQNWKSHHEQVDDVCLMGVKIK